MLKTALLAALCCVVLSAGAEARTHHHYRVAAQPACADIFCWFGQAQQPANPKLRNLRHLASNSTGQIVAHPGGCPRSAFCGCGASVRLFGHSVRGLWLASNWFRFPRAAPAPGMAAVRSHHVMVLEADLGGGVWQVYDANSGGHATRVHARSIAGYTIVNPTGGA
jgi:hypothetical protein